MADHFEEHKSPEGESAPPQLESQKSADEVSNSDDAILQEPANEPQPSTPEYSSSSDPYGVDSDLSLTPALEEPAPAEHLEADTVSSAPAQVPATIPPPPPSPPPPGDDDGEGDEEERGMLRMSFMEHLEELRSRVLRALIGVIVAFLVSLSFANPLWKVVASPATNALKHLGIHPPNLVAISPMDQFNIIYLKLPLLVSIFLGSPWILYQVWAFISPGLYKREKRWAVPFILCTAGLFIAGGLFAYFVAFRYGLEFLLGIGRDVSISPMVSMVAYFDLFVNVTLGVGLVFEMPVLIFFLTLLRIASPRFLIRHSRYAILAITIIAAIVTPTPDVFNMMIFAVPMVMLFFVGVFASHLLVLKREGKKFPWGKVLLIILGVALVVAGNIALLLYRYHYHVIYKWPYLVK
ncbi:MAG: twin-arginine translocase subunit TatC [Bryobacteraceae bacterium]